MIALVRWWMFLICMLLVVSISVLVGWTARDLGGSFLALFLFVFLAPATFPTLFALYRLAMRKPVPVLAQWLVIAGALWAVFFAYRNFLSSPPLPQAAG